MTDEELGRAWCEANGRRPLRHTDIEDEPGHCMWGNFQFGPLWAFFGEPGTGSGYSSESAAYAAVGSALRRVWAFADQSRSQTGDRS